MKAYGNSILQTLDSEEGFKLKKSCIYLKRFISSQDDLRNLIKKVIPGLQKQPADSAIVLINLIASALKELQSDQRLSKEETNSIFEQENTLDTLEALQTHGD